MCRRAEFALPLSIAAENVAWVLAMIIGASIVLLLKLWRWACKRVPSNDAPASPEHTGGGVDVLDKEHVADFNVEDDEEGCFEEAPEKAAVWLARQLKGDTAQSRVFSISGSWLADHGDDCFQRLDAILSHAGYLCLVRRPEVLIYKHIAAFGIAASHSTPMIKPADSKDAAPSTSSFGQQQQQQSEVGQTTASMTSTSASHPSRRIAVEACSQCADVTLAADANNACCQVPPSATSWVLLAFTSERVVVRKRSRASQAAAVDASVDVGLRCCVSWQGHLCIKITLIKGRVTRPASLPQHVVDGSPITFLEKVRVQLDAQLNGQPCQLFLDLPANTDSGTRIIQRGSCSIDHVQLTSSREWHGELGLSSSQLVRLGASSRPQERLMVQRGAHPRTWAEAHDDVIYREPGFSGTTVQLVQHVDQTLIADCTYRASALAFEDDDPPIRLAGHSGSAEDAAPRVELRCRVDMEVSTAPSVEQSFQRQSWEPRLNGGRWNLLSISFTKPSHTNGCVILKTPEGTAGA